MPEFPEKKSQSKDTANSLSFNPISSGFLLNNGWKKTQEQINGSWISTYTKGFDSITYDGTNFMYYDFPGCVKDDNWGVDGLKIVPRKIEYVEDLNKKNSDTRPE